MTEGRLENEWNHTSYIVATLLNVNREKGKPAIDPKQIHPMHAKKTDEKKSRGIAAAMNRDLKENLRRIGRK